MTNEELAVEVESIRSYMDNYVQPLAGSVEKLVSNMETMQLRLNEMEEKLKYVMGRISEQDRDMADVFRIMSTLAK